MRYCITIASAFALWVGAALAEIEEARDLMEEGRFVEARELLWPAARSGNADAEELIGVMYAMGLGVEQDYQRAFDWYLRSSMKGHPGAQSGAHTRLRAIWCGLVLRGWPWNADAGLDARLYVVCSFRDRRRP